MGSKLGPSVTPELTRPLVSMLCRALRAARCFPPPPCPREALIPRGGAWAWALLVAGPLQVPACPTPLQPPPQPAPERRQEHLGSVPGESDCHHSCSTGILESVNWAGRPAPGPTVSRNELGQGEKPHCLPCIGELGQAMPVSCTEGKVRDASPGLWAAATLLASVRWGRDGDPRCQTAHREEEPGMLSGDFQRFRKGVLSGSGAGTGVGM